MFEKASRLKIRYETAQGTITAEDLWDLPLTSRKDGILTLDSLAKFYNRAVKSTEESFVTKPAKKDAIMQLKFDLVIHVINTLIAERDAAKLAADIRAKKAKIMDLIVAKEDDVLKESSIEDLKKQLDELAA